MVNASFITDFDECKYFELIRLLDNQQIISFSFQEGHYFFEVKLDGQRKFYEKNENPQPFENVKVWTNDQHYPNAASVRIRNLHIESAGNFLYSEGKCSKFQIHILHTVCTLHLNVSKAKEHIFRITSHLVLDEHRHF